VRHPLFARNRVEMEPVRPNARPRVEPLSCNMPPHPNACARVARGLAIRRRGKRAKPFTHDERLAAGDSFGGDPHFQISEKALQYNRRMFEPAEAQFRRNMRELARRGGAATKRLAGTDRNYYASIGRLGGRASVAARKARIVKELQTASADGSSSVESSGASISTAVPEAAEATPPTTKPVEQEGSFGQTLSESYAHGRRIAELLAKFLDDAGDESP
jgi:general stress protein YciG